MQHETAHSMHQHCLPGCRTLSGITPVVSRRLHMNEWQGDKLGETSTALLQITDCKQMARPVHGRLHMAEHDCCGCPEPHAIAAPDHVKPLLHMEFVQHQAGAHMLRENFT